MSETFHFVTTDGLRIGLQHLAAPSKNGLHPVLMIHGLGANHKTFTLEGADSFAHYLNEKGFSVWLLDLRGHGKSETPRRGKKPSQWNMDHYLEFDIPEAIAFIEAKETEHERKDFQLHIVGHSMGGMLALSHLSQTNDKRILSVVTAGASLHHHGTASDFSRLRFLLKLSKRLKFNPIKSIGAQVGSVVSKSLVRKFLKRTEKFLYVPENISKETAVLIFSEMFEDIPHEELEQISTIYSERGLSSFDRSKHYLTDLHKVETPVLMFAGQHDEQCSVEAVQKTYNGLGKNRQINVVDLGHIDLFVGKKAQALVYPEIEAWLTGFTSGRKRAKKESPK